MKTVKHIFIFAICLWAVAVITYAAQVHNDRQNGKLAKEIIPMQNSTSCSGDPSSSGDPE